MLELRTSGGVTRLTVRYLNGGAEEAGSDRFEADKIVLVDVEAKQKHSPLKDANGQFIAGPIGDEIGGGRLPRPPATADDVLASDACAPR